jgi:hypothetical protein
VCTLNCPIVGARCPNGEVPVSGIQANGCPTCPLCPSGAVGSPVSVPSSNDNNGGGGVQSVETSPPAVVNPPSVVVPAAPAGGSVNTGSSESAGGPTVSVLPGGSKCTLVCPIVPTTCANGATPVSGIDANGCPTCLLCPNESSVSSSSSSSSSANSNGGSEAINSGSGVTVKEPSSPVSSSGSSSGSACPNLSACPPTIECAPGGTVVRTPLILSNGCQACDNQRCEYLGDTVGTTKHKATTTNKHATTTKKPVATTKPAPTTARPSTTVKPIVVNTQPQPVITAPVYSAPPVVQPIVSSGGGSSGNCPALSCSRVPPTCYAPHTLVTLSSVDATTGCAQCADYACSCDPLQACPALTAPNCVRPNGGWMSEMYCNCMQPVCTETATVSIRASGMTVDECGSMTSSKTGASCYCSAQQGGSVFSVQCTGSQTQSSDSYDAATSSSLFMQGVQTSLAGYVADDSSNTVAVGATIADNHSEQGAASTYSLALAALVVALAALF